jgi:hypothetical protein
MEFTPVYALREFLVSPLAPGKGKAILVTTTHEFYYPAQAALLSPQGKVLREYWHSGHLMFLHAADMDGDGRVEFYLAGINNARHAATLVVLDLDHFAGASQEPQAPDHQLEPFAKGSERARVILPRSCLNRAFSPYNTVVDMVAEDGKITVETAEVLEPISAGIIHHLTPDFRTHQMVLSDAYELAYRRARISGLLQDCNLNDPGLNSLDVLGTPR